MRHIDELEGKRKKLSKAATTRGSEGEQGAMMLFKNLIDRPKGKDMKNLLQALSQLGLNIKPTSFDKIDSGGIEINFSDVNHLVKILSQITFIEVKSTDRKSIPEDFSGYFFALTENEIDASIILGDRYKVLLINKVTGYSKWTTVKALLERAKSKTWQVSLNLGAEP